VIAAPEGAEQSWPPPLGGSVEAVVSGTLDTDDASEIVVMMSGTESQAGMYVLDGGTDLAFNSGDTGVRSFSRFVPTSWTAPMSASYIAGVAPRVLVAHSEAKITITELSNTLAEVASGETSIDGGGTTLWTTFVDFPGAMPHATASNGSLIDHLASDFSDPRPIPAPMSLTWDGAQLALSYTSGADQVVVVALANKIVRAPLPTTAGAMFAWADVRADGAAWSGMTAFDLDGDGRKEILGVDLAAHELCVLDPGAAAIPVMPSCVDLGTTFPGNDVTILLGQNLSPNPLDDILIAQASATDTRYTVLEEVTYASGAFGAGSAMPVQVVGPPHGRSVIAGGGGDPFVVLTFGTDAHVVCALGPC
jgi:hypothetical protein